jgi:hypothetical protein
VGEAPLTVLRLLYRYRYLTRELLEPVYAAERGGRGERQLRDHLTQLWRYGYVERFYRPAESGWGSQQYVYALRAEGAHLVLPPAEWAVVRRRVHNRLRRRSDYEHALAVSLVRVLWDLGAPTFADRFKTKLYWQDKEGEKAHPVNRFVVRLGSQRVTIDPDSTALVAFRERNYYRPVFIEVERTHKNAERLTRRFKAYEALLTDQRAVATTVFQREAGISPEKGLALFVGADEAHRDRLLALARATVRPYTSHRAAPEMWFLALTDLVDRHVAGDVQGGREIVRETLIPPADLFTRRHAIRLDGEWGSILG